MEEQIKDIQTFPLTGGVDTVREIALLGGDKFSTLQNLRPRYAGFEKRKGQIKLHSTASSSLEALNVFQFSKGSQTERHLFRQAVNGSVEKATNNPPTVTTGAFGSNVLPSATSAIPASVSIVDDICLLSDGARQQQIWTGNARPIDKFIVYRGTTDLISNNNAIPSDGSDYTREVTDNDSSTIAVLDGLQNWAFGYDCLFIKTSVQAKAFNFTVASANANISDIEVRNWIGSWNYSGALTVTDGTSVGGKTLAQSGTISFTPSYRTDEQPKYMFGEFGYWYMLTVTASLSATVRISEITFEADWQSLSNLFNNVLIDPIEIKVWKNTQQRYLTYASSSIDLSKLEAGDKVYFASLDKVGGFYIDPSATANIVKATVTGTDISFVSGGAGNEDIIKRSKADFLQQGFEAGQTIVITGSISNNRTLTIVKATTNALYVPTASLTNESAGANVTILFGINTTAINGVYAWTETSWSSLPNLNDGSTGITKDGFVTFGIYSVNAKKMQFEGSPYHAYWYYFTVSKTLSEKVNVGIQVIPYYDILDFGNKGICNTEWQNRAVYVFDKNPHTLYISEQGNPFALNGSDFAVLEAGDGRENKIKCMRVFNDDYLMIWQEERGGKGGCTTIFSGDRPANFKKNILSARVGALNSKSAVILDGVEMLPTATDAGIKSIAFWLSKYGVYASDGNTIILISENIQNYFDPKKAECIRAGYEDKMWLNYDSADNCLRLGLVSGSSATAPNIFPVFHIKGKTWSFDKLGQSLTCFMEVEGAAGNIFNLQIGGGMDGFVYQCNQTYNDDTTPIDAELTIELDGKGGRVHLTQEALRCKTQSSGNITQTISVDGNPTIKNTQILSMIAVNSGDVYRRHRFNLNVEGHHLSAKLRNNESNVNIYFEDIGFIAKRKGGWT